MALVLWKFTITVNQHILFWQVFNVLYMLCSLGACSMVTDTNSFGAILNSATVPVPVQHQIVVKNFFGLIPQKPQIWQYHCIRAINCDLYAIQLEA